MSILWMGVGTKHRINLPIYIHEKETGLGEQLELWGWVFIAVQITYKVQHHNQRMVYKYS